MPVYKNETRGTWYVSFYYQDFTGKRRKKKKEGFATKREAKAWERSFLEEAAGTPEMTFETLAGAYFRSAEQRLKPQTFYTKQNLCRNHILPYFKDTALTDITPARVRAWQDTLMQAGRKAGGREANPSA